MTNVTDERKPFATFAGFVSMEFLLQPWPWYVTGPLIGVMVPLLLYLGSSFGISGNLETICSIAGAGKISDYFNVDLKTKLPRLMFAVGATLGGFVAGHFLTAENYSIDLSSAAISTISAYGISDFLGLQPTELFNWNFLASVNGIILLCIGGFLIGFGTRYAGGCTSGHSITGLSSFQWPSLVATIGFFIGGLITTHFILPLIF